MMGKRKVFNCIYCAQPVTDRHHAIASKNEYTHDGKAGLSLRWCTWEFFCLIDAFMFHLNEPRLEKSNRKAMNRNWGNQKANPALKTKTGNK